jgi:hypothetical protein
LSNPQRGSASIALPASRRSAETKSTLIEQISDLRINVVFEQLEQISSKRCQSALFIARRET